MSKLVRFGLLALAIGVSPAATFAQEAASVPTDEEVVAAMHAAEAQIGPGKHDFIEQQLALSPEQAKKFWPIYDAHQEALKKFNQRRIDNILAYAKVFNSDSLTDAEANRLAEAALAIEKEEVDELAQTYAKVKAVLPGLKAVNYLQIEAKLRALVRYKQASEVPVVSKSQ
jgi:Spy/CpxP family protein refolding chaperone